MNNNNDGLVKHYQQEWLSKPVRRNWTQGPVSQLPDNFEVIEFSPSEQSKVWIYATYCMSSLNDDDPIELFICSPIQSELLVELLTIISHFHHTAHRLNLGHTVNFGRPWLPGSICTYGLISRAYIMAPQFEECWIENTCIKCYWLVPITRSERDYKKLKGLNALEEKFEEFEFNYLDPTRFPVV